MAASKAIEQYLERLTRAVLKATKTAMERVPMELSAYVLDYMDKGDPVVKAPAQGRRKTKAGNLYYSQTNDTKRLRTLYGNLTRALIPGEAGNVSEVSVDGGTFTVNYSIDVNTKVRAGTRTTSLIYAQLHELGTGGQKKRPYLKPGIAEYLKDKAGFPALIRELETDIIDEIS